MLATGDDKENGVYRGYEVDFSGATLETTFRFYKFNWNYSEAKYRATLTKSSFEVTASRVNPTAAGGQMKSGYGIEAA